MKLLRLPRSQNLKQSLLHQLFRGLLLGTLASAFLIVIPLAISKGYLVKAIILEPQGDLDGAIAAHQKALELNPFDDWIFLYQGNLLLHQKKIDQAIAAYQNAIQLKPHNPLGYISLGDAFMQQKNFDQAIVVYEKAIQLDPKNSETYVKLALALENQREFNKIVYSFFVSLGAAPSWETYNNGVSTVSSLISKFNAQYNQGKLEKVVSIYKQAVQLDTTNSLAYSRLAERLAMRGDLEPAITAYRKSVELEPENIDYLFFLGVMLSAAGKQDEAIAINKKIIQLQPNLFNAYFSLSTNLFRKGKVEEAISVYEKLIEQEPEELQAYYYLGAMLFLKKEYAKAINVYKKAIAINQEAAFQSNIYQSLAIAFYKQGRLAEAITAYEVELFHHVNNITAYSEIAEILLEQDQPGKAWNWCIQGMQLNPESAEPHICLASVLKKRNNLEKAIQEIKQAIVLEPDNKLYPSLLREPQRRLALQKNPQLALAPERLPNKKQQPLLPLLRSVVQLRSSTGQFGTGWVVKRKGNQAIVVTNRHVVTEDDQKAWVKDWQAEFYSEPLPPYLRHRQPAKILHTTAAVDPLDIAVLEVTNVPTDIQALPLTSAIPTPGTSVITIGHPFIADGWTISKGAINQPTDSSKLKDEIVFTAICASGSSGGPVLNSKHQVIGVGWGGRVVQSYGSSAVFDRCYAERMDLVIKQLQAWKVL